MERKFSEEEICSTAVLLRRCGIVLQSDFAANAEPLLLGLDADVQVVVGAGEGLAVERKAIHRGCAEETEDAAAIGIAIVIVLPFYHRR